jgi:hypothetical protein
MSTRELERRGNKAPEEIGFEQSVDAKDYMRISKLIRRAEEDESGGNDQRSWVAAKLRGLQQTKDGRSRSGSNEYEYEINYDDSSNSASPLAHPVAHFNTSQVRPRPQFRPLNKENACANAQSVDWRNSSERLDMPMLANLSHKEVKYTPAAHPPKSRKIKRKDNPKQSFQMQLMMEKLSQLKEIEKQSKNIKSSALSKGL